MLENVYPFMTEIYKRSSLEDPVAANYLQKRSFLKKYKPFIPKKK